MEKRKKAMKISVQSWEASALWNAKLWKADYRSLSNASVSSLKKIAYDEKSLAKKATMAYQLF